MAAQTHSRYTWTTIYGWQDDWHTAVKWTVRDWRMFNNIFTQGLKATQVVVYVLYINNKLNYITVFIDSLVLWWCQVTLHMYDFALAQKKYLQMLQVSVQLRINISHFWSLLFYFSSFCVKVTHLLLLYNNLEECRMNDNENSFFNSVNSLGEACASLFSLYNSLYCYQQILGHNIDVSCVNN